MKTAQIIIDIQPYMNSISLIESGRLLEHYCEFKESTNITGNIYKGMVVNVIKNLQSAFVSFGNVRNGFLSVEETLGHKTVMSTSGIMPTSLSAKEGDYIMVQATKEEIGTKGARLTTNITIPGKYVVYLPTLDFVGISNKITDQKSIDTLTATLKKVKPKNGGFIARTACLEAKKSDILAEVKQLFGVWENIQNEYKKAEGIAQIYSDGDMIFRTVRDMASPNLESILVNDLSAAESLKRKLKENKSKYTDKVHFYAGQNDILSEFGILKEVDKLLDRKVELDNGASLIIDYTEALTVIDVNTARFSAGENHEETVYKTNLSAAREIARQIRLRNIGGIIIIDFIDMLEEEHRNAVLAELKDEMLFDRTKTRIAGMTSLGLVEMTRKKVGRELSTILLDKCHHCNGYALEHSVTYIARKIKRDITNLFALGYTSAVLTIDEGFFSQMFGSFFSEEVKTIWADMRIYVVPSLRQEKGYYRIKGTQGTVIDVPPNAKMLY